MQEIDGKAVPAHPEKRPRNPFAVAADSWSKRKAGGNRRGKPRRRDSGQHDAEPREHRHEVVGAREIGCQPQPDERGVVEGGAGQQWGKREAEDCRGDHDRQRSADEGEAEHARQRDVVQDAEEDEIVRETQTK